MTDIIEAAEEAATPIEEIVPEAASEAVEEAPEPVAEPEPAPAAAAIDEKPEPFWYRKTLKEKEGRIKQLERELETRSAAPPPQQYAQPQGEIPNPYDDPEGYHRAIVQQAAAQTQAIVQSQHLTMCNLMARQKHGDQVVDEMLEWTNDRPDVQQWAMTQANPHEAAITAYNREKLAAEIGDSPDVWREKERERIRQELIGEIGQPANQMQPRPVLPGAASQTRSARAPNGQWAGPVPTAGLLKNNF